MLLSIRRWVEIASKRVTFRTRLPRRFGSRPIYVSPGNHLAVLKRGDSKFEAYLLGFADRFLDAESVVWDIGANMGMFAFPAAHRAKFTLAFEPDPFNLELLHRTQAANPDLKIDVLPVALSNEIGIAKLAIPERGRSANSLVGVNFGTQMGGVRQHYSVVTVTADWVMERYPPPTFVKCDAEGAEAWILEGATRMLEAARPLIVIEMPNENADRCAEIFRANRYVMMSSYTKVDRAHLVDDIHNVWDVLAIPEEKFESYIGR
jgi:FkbM family methyltransferase